MTNTCLLSAEITECFSYNDKNNHVVNNFVETNKKDFEIVRSGIANGNIDIYKSHKLSKDFVHFVFIDDPKKPSLALEPEIDVEQPKPKPKILQKRTSKSLLKPKCSKKPSLASEPGVEVED